MICFYTGLACICKHYVEVVAKSKTSKIVGFKEYLENLPHLWPSEEKVSSNKDEE